MSVSEPTADVLIIGAGASGAALAWSLADTRMHIVCLEQGDWVDPASMPGMSVGWEARQATDWNFSPNVRGRREDYPVNDQDSPDRKSTRLNSSHHQVSRMPSSA